MKITILLIKFNISDDLNILIQLEI